MKSFFVSLAGSSGRERTIVISMSKIRNRRAIRKNWNENGERAGENLSNPHSNLTHLFISPLSFFEIAPISRSMSNRIVSTMAVVTRSFIYSLVVMTLISIGVSRGEFIQRLRSVSIMQSIQILLYGPRMRTYGSVEWLKLLEILIQLAREVHGSPLL
jgi:hypothetical protein